MAPPTQADQGPRAAELIEEAVHLLRRHPRELAGYYAGTGLFAAALLYGWAFVTWFVPPDGEVAAGALLLVLLFGLMKAAQARFARRLMALRGGEELPPTGWRWWLGETAAQLRAQGTGLVLVPLAALFAVPFAWIYGYYQSLTAMPPAEGETPAARRAAAWAQARLWPVQHHWALAILAGLWLMVWLNIAVTFYSVPALATRWLGLKTIFSVEGWSYMNTTYLALVVTLTHLLVDPLIKAYYVLRVFHGRARQTGADLRLVVRRERAAALRTAAVLMLVLAAGLTSAPRLQAAEPVAKTVQAAPAAALDPALDRVLEQGEYSWRLRPLPVPPEQKKEGIIKGFVRATVKTIGQMVKTVKGWFSGLQDWLSGLFPSKKKADDPVDAAKPSARHNPYDWMGVLQVTAYILLCVVAGLLIFVAWKVWRHNRGVAPLRSSLPLTAAVPDLRDERVEASRLPEDGWLALARQQMAAGEWRLALRALFLATLARRAQEGLLTLARFKTNLDYESELRRRAHSRTALVDEFRGRRRQFEQVWYGDTPASDTLVREWLQHMEGRG